MTALLLFLVTTSSSTDFELPFLFYIIYTASIKGSHCSGILLKAMNAYGYVDIMQLDQFSFV